MAAGASSYDRPNAGGPEQESEQQLKLLVETIPGMVWTARPDGTFHYRNQRWIDYTGLTLAQSAGRGWEMVVHPLDLQPSRDGWDRCVATGGPY